jgi:hypothetical protein
MTHELSPLPPSRLRDTSLPFSATQQRRACNSRGEDMHEIIASRLGACLACVAGVGLVILGAVGHTLTDIKWVPLVLASAGVVLFTGGVLAYRRALREMRREHRF